MKPNTFSIMASLAFDALAEVKSAILIVDAGAFDLPIVYMNPAFKLLTGYDEHEVIGRNCRFLQGPETDRRCVREIKKALDEHKSAHTILLNYRKDGSRFFNELFINPIRNTDGMTTHFVGCQNAVESPRKESLQSEARRRFETLSTRERLVFEGLVRGTTIKDIAGRQSLSPRTVEKYRYRMQKKLGQKSLTMLVRYAIALGTDFDDAKSA